MKKMVALAILLLPVTTIVHAQAPYQKTTVEDSVRTAVMNFESTINSSNGRNYGRCFADTSATLETIVYDRRGLPQVKRESILANANAIAQLPPGTLEQRVDAITVKVDGPLAHAWVPYKFYYAGKLQYCGVQSFHFIRLFGFWMIYYMIETRYTNKCG